MDIEDNDFLEFAKYANEENLKYIVIGGFAMNLHGLYRHTEDVDIWVEPTNENKINLVKVFLKTRYTLEELEEVSEMNFTEPVVFSAMGYLDILNVVHRSLNYYECEKVSIIQTLKNNSTCRFLHLNHLRESKILAHRPQDLRDVIMIDDLLKKLGNV